MFWEIYQDNKKLYFSNKNLKFKIQQKKLASQQGFFSDNFFTAYKPTLLALLASLDTFFSGHNWLNPIPPPQIWIGESRGLQQGGGE